MTEIDQLRQDIAKLKAAAAVETNCRGTNHLLWHEIDMLSSKLSEAEEVAKMPEPDPEPKKWGGKVDGKWVLDGFGKPLRFYSREAAKYVFSDAVEIVPYTGDQK